MGAEPAACRMATNERRPDHVDLDRRFQEAGADTDPWASVLRDERQWDWTWLTNHYAVALLAEAGSGKTHELRQLAAAPELGQHRFLLRVEALCGGTVDAAHDTGEQKHAFEEWLQSGVEGLFLLDAVDEAKLPQSRTAAPLRDALAALRRAMTDELHRVRIIVSCRSSEWHDQTEQEPLEAFAAAMASARKHHGLDVGDERVLAVTFAPLTTNAIDKLGRFRGADNHFVEAMRESGALDHAVTPLDVIHYADVYVDQRDRGGPGFPRTRGALARASVARRLAEAGATWMRSKLGPDEALGGARLLCFALAMAQCRDLIYPGGGGAGMDAAAVLAGAHPPWNTARARELLSTALFVSAGQGTVRPYRPEVAAMLAADHVDQLIAQGLSEQRVVEDFFHKSFGKEVIGRAHGAMLAWLASMQPTVLRRMIEVSPELLIEDGDPRALAFEDRVAALERHVASADALPGGFFFQMTDLRRFAEPGLERDVVRLLYETPHGEGRLHLLQLVRAGHYTTATPLLVQFAGDPFTPTDVRIYAMSALVECGRPEDLAKCAQTMLAWGAPIYRPGEHSFERQREDDARHRLVRYAYPGAIDAGAALRLLAQIAGKEWSTNAEPLAAALAAAPIADLEQLVTELDRLCFPRGDGARPHAAPPASERMPDLFRSLVTLIGRAIRERPDMHALLVPIHGRCLRTLRWERGNRFVSKERADNLFGVVEEFRFAILDAYASGALVGPLHRVLEHFLPTGGLDAKSAVAEAPKLLKHYVAADRQGRQVYAEVLSTWIRYMPASHSSAWRRRLWREARGHREGRDNETLANIRWRPIAKVVGASRKLRAEVPWRAEFAWIRLRHFVRERWSKFYALCRDFRHLSDGRAVGLILSLLDSEEAESPIVLDPAAARRRPFGSKLVRGAVAHARRHAPTARGGEYIWSDLLAFAGWGYLWEDSRAAFLAMSDDDARRAVHIALTSPLAWPVWASDLAVTRPELFRTAVLKAAQDEVIQYRVCDPRVTPHVLGRVSELELSLRATVASELVALASGTWLPGKGAVRALRIIAEANPPALAELRLLARRRAREAVWEGAITRVPEWVTLWAAAQPAAIDELLALRRGPLSGEMGSSAMVRGLEPLLSSENPEEDRLACLDLDLLVALAAHLITTFPLADDDRREGRFTHDDRRRAEEVRGAVLKLLGERRDAEGRTALEAFVEQYIEPYSSRWASAWLAGHARDSADPAPWPIDQVTSYGSLTSRRPATADSLLAAVLQGLRDIELDLASSEFDRRALFRDAWETDIRAFLGHELDQRHRDHYAITQETVTAREKRSDLRFELREVSGSILVVEIKLLHRWTWMELCDKLVTQLLQQYLISDRVAHGIYLLVDLGRPPTGECPSGIIDVDGLIEMLRQLVLTDDRFKGRRIEIMKIRIDIPADRDRRRKP